MPKIKKSKKGATVVSIQDIGARQVALSSIWKRAAGLLRGRVSDPVAVQRQMRSGWDQRWQKQLRLSKTKHDA